MMRNDSSPAVRTSALLTGLTLLAHLAVAHRYDFFRDELYFIQCGRHPAFGYVDQPPLVPLLSAASQMFGLHLVLLRAISAVAGALTVWVTCSLARLVGAGAPGVLLAGAAAGFAPMYLGLSTVVSTSVFEPLAWTALIYCVARAVVLRESRWWIIVGLVVGIDLEAKYELLFFLAPLILALLLCGQWRAAFSRGAALAAVIALLLAAPSAIWQVMHGLPFVELLRNGAAGKNVVLAPLEFVKQQILVMNPLFAPLWIAGLLGPFLDRRLARWRFAALTCTLTFLLMLGLHAKDYYVAPIYGTLFALGGATCELWIARGWMRAVYLTAALAMSVLLAPLAMPILDPPVLVRYLEALHLAPKAQENLKQSPIPQTFADMLGWREYVASVTRAYRSLPPDDRARTAIITGNYGEAAALDVLGKGQGLPPALSVHNQYWLWGPGSYDGSMLIRINEEPEKLARRCESVALLGRFGAPLVMPYENDAPITLCRRLHPPLGELWKDIKVYY